ncbi:hypothetical protein BCR32DRAFT_330730 [Anaeromyces robustus]|uniref:Transglutaminase-like domain-containing protein n=1 Tax=Anaeromyces robustus TaxID=1754192 RepID=A0A1Y1VRT3_9FUNG|nr:hypothetical protein BCR32DRAFT_330730 [Anaeromyces robustus]|eukprot:ORX63990.1 hypothetical protein BCR32DRAFT_330730 [Anaeromyces robustus]
MKCLGSFILLALLNLLTVFAGPPPSVYVKDASFEYYIMLDSSNVAYITNVLNKNVKTITVNPYVYYNGQRYTVSAFASGVADSAVEKIIVPSYLNHYFSIWNSVFSEGKKLKTLQIDATNVEIFEDSAKDASSELQIQGKGVDNMIMKYAKKYLESHNISIDENIRYASDYEKKCALYKIAKLVNKNFTYTLNMANPNNGAVALLLGKGSSLGLARVVRILALASGYEQIDIRVGGDNIYQGWNYAKFGTSWYILDSVHSEFKDRDTCSTSVFQCSEQFIKGVLNPYYGRLYQGSVDNFIIFHDLYGYPNEVYDATPDNFLIWLQRNRQGALTYSC